MNISLIDVDGYKQQGKPFPNLAQMKISSHHKSLGDHVERHFGFNNYDITYMSKVFDYTPDFNLPINADLIIKGGTGYIHGELQKEFIEERKHSRIKHNEKILLRDATVEQVWYQDILDNEIEHAFPDYSLYGIKDTAYGFLTRGCPRGCDFCIVGKKEGRCSRKVADLKEFWNGQKEIKLLDPNLLAAPQHIELLEQLIESNAWVDITQGFDIRLTNFKNIDLIKKMKVKMLHFAWDKEKDEKIIIEKLKQFKELTNFDFRKLRVYILTNFDTTFEYDLYRIYKLKELGYDPYVMVYEKWKAPKEIKRLQRWVNNKFIFRSCEKFEDYQKIKG